MFKEIVINSKTYGQFSIKVDEKYFDWLSRFFWHVEKTNNNFYAITNYGQGKNRFSIRMHNLLFPDGKVVDHINGNGLDNRECNLRPTTQGNNAKNKRKTNGLTTSKYKGVVKVKNVWKVSFTFNYKTIYNGTFSTEESAATAYNVYARKYYKEFANLNKLEEVSNWQDFKLERSRSSKYKHICYDKSRNRWALNYKKIRKRFETEELAYNYYLKVINGNF